MSRYKYPLFPPVTTLALAAVLALTMTGCGGEDTPMAPADTGFSLANLFTEDEAVVEVGSSDTLLRMVGVKFTDRISSTLTDASLPILDKFKTVFKQLPSARYRIEGHTDNQGAHDANQILSEQRANRVRDYFIAQLGGPTAYITATGYGSDRPIADNSTAAGRALNDRVEIIVQNPTGDPVFTIALTADNLTVYQDCDAMGGSASSAAGDFYITVELGTFANGQYMLISHTVNKLVQLNDGESASLDIQASGQFIASNDARLRTAVSIFENDTNGHQFDRANDWIFFYDTATKCWKLDDGTDACVGAGKSTGDIIEVAFPVRNVPGDPCSLDLAWRLQAEHVNK